MSKGRFLTAEDRLHLADLPTLFMEDLAAGRHEYRIVLLDGRAIVCSDLPDIARDPSGDIWLEFWQGEDEGGMVAIPTRSILYLEQIRREAT